MSQNKPAENKMGTMPVNRLLLSMSIPSMEIMMGKDMENSSRPTGMIPILFSLEISSSLILFPPSKNIQAWSSLDDNSWTGWQIDTYICISFNVGNATIKLPRIQF